MGSVISIVTLKSLVSQPQFMELGFFIATTVITLTWNINWRHYIRYWLGPGAPYQPWKRILMRGFFLVCLIGSAVQLVLEIVKLHPILNKLGVALFDAALIMAIFFALDIVFRWYWGRPKDSIEH